MRVLTDYEKQLWDSKSPVFQKYIKDYKEDSEDIDQLTDKELEDIRFRYDFCWLPHMVHQIKHDKYGNRNIIIYTKLNGRYRLVVCDIFGKVSKDDLKVHIYDLYLAESALRNYESKLEEYKKKITAKGYQYYHKKEYLEMTTDVQFGRYSYREYSKYDVVYIKKLDLYMELSDALEYFAFINCPLLFDWNREIHEIYITDIIKVKAIKDNYRSIDRYFNGLSVNGHAKNIRRIKKQIKESENKLRDYLKSFKFTKSQIEKFMSNL